MQFESRTGVCRAQQPLRAYQPQCRTQYASQGSNEALTVKLGNHISAHGSWCSSATLISTSPVSLLLLAKHQSTWEMQHQFGFAFRDNKPKDTDTWLCPTNLYWNTGMATGVSGNVPLEIQGLCSQFEGHGIKHYVEHINLWGQMLSYKHKNKTQTQISIHQQGCNKDRTPALFPKKRNWINNPLGF